MNLKRFSMLMPLVLISAVGCADTPTGVPPEGEQPAYLEYYGDGPRIQVPTEVVVGQTIEISVQTFGGGCIRGGRTEVEVTGHRILVRPYDVYPKPDANCTADIRFIDHVASVEVEAEGSYAVEVRGTRAYTGADSKPRIEAVSFERAVNVRSQG
jgi:hypothetical protein